jgi:uncharacterized membrane protein
MEKLTKRKEKKVRKSKKQTVVRHRLFVAKKLIKNLFRKKESTMNISKFLILGMLVASLVMVTAGPTEAASDPSYDMTYPGSDIEISETINGAIWLSLPSTEATGSGVFNAFFRVQANGTEQGYNTDGRPLEFDELKSATFTHSALFEDVPRVEYPASSGFWYYEFQLDINEKSSAGLMSMDKFEVYTTNDQYILNYPFEDGTGGNNSGEAKLIYELDGDGDTWILMDYAWNTGSGKRDYRVLIPESDFTGKKLTYVVIFTRHGDNEATDDGFEEWGVAIYPTEPDTMVTILTSAAPDGDLIYAGDTVDLTVTETNTGNAPLDNVSVTVTGGSLNVTLDETDPSWDDGAGNGDAVLDPGETWTWTISGVVVNAQTTFTVTGYGEDDGTAITYPDYPNEQAQITVYTIDPDTLVDIDASPYLIYAGESVDLDVSEKNTGDDPLTNVSVTVTGGGLNVTLDENTAGWSSDGNLDDVLDPGETWSWTILDVAVSADTTFTAIGTGTDSLGGTVTVPDYEGEEDTVDVYVIGPNTTVTIDTVGSVYLVHEGDTVNLDVSEKNTGDDPLTNVSVTVTGGGLNVTLDENTAGWSSDVNGDDVLDPGETWSWTISSNAITSQTTFTATGTGTDSLGGTVTVPDYENEEDSVVVDVIGPNTTVTIDTVGSVYLVYDGETVDLDVSEKNTGNDPLKNVYVVVTGGGLNETLDENTAGWSSDGNLDDVLDPGETWTWTISGVTVSGQTTFTATGHGTDSLGSDVTHPAYPSEQDTVEVSTIGPNTTVTIDTVGSVYLVYAGETVDLDVSEKNTGDDPLTNVSVTVDDGSVDIATLDENTAGWSSDGNLDAVLDPGETWSWTISGVTVNSDTTFTATGTGTDSLGGDVTYPDYPDEQDTVDVDTIDPDTLVTIEPDVYETIPGGNVILTISEKNTGDDPLTNVSVTVTGGGLNVTLDELDLSWSSDVNGDDVLDPGETWTWTIQVTIWVDTTFTATGTGTDSLGNPVTVPVYPFEYDEVFVEVEQDFTRTWGFWKTHLYLVQYALDPANGLGITPIDLGDWGQGPMIINNDCDYMGLMWSKQSQNSDGGPRKKIDAARIHTAHQALAAIMNYNMPNGATIPVSPAEIANILTTGNVKQIRDLGSQLAAYNESGEDVALDPSLPPTGKISGNIADPQGARDIGAPCEDYWDTPEATKGGGKPPK